MKQLKVQEWDKESDTLSLLTLQKLMTREAEKIVRNPEESVDKALTLLQKGLFTMWLDTDLLLHFEEVSE